MGATAEPLIPEADQPFDLDDLRQYVPLSKAHEDDELRQVFSTYATSQNHYANRHANGMHEHQVFLKQNPRRVLVWRPGVRAYMAHLRKTTP